MRILLYSSQANSLTEKLDTMLRATAGGEEVEKIHDINMLERRLRQWPPQDDGEVLILLSKDRKELAEVVKLRETLMWDHRLILILPDRSAANTDIGHRLRPRYIGVQDEGWTDVIQVLTKMGALAKAANR